MDEITIVEEDNFIRKECEKLYRGKGKLSDIGDYIECRLTKNLNQRTLQIAEHHRYLQECYEKIKKDLPIK